MLLRDWALAPTFDWISPTTGSYEVDVRCATDLTCENTAIGFVDVVTDLAPPALGNSLRAVRASTDISLAWAAEALATSYSLYRELNKKTWGPPYLEDIPAVTQIVTGDVPPPP